MQVISGVNRGSSCGHNMWVISCACFIHNLLCTSIKCRSLKIQTGSDFDLLKKLNFWECSDLTLKSDSTNNLCVPWLRFYSGAVAGAREALICGVPSLCISFNWWLLFLCFISSQKNPFEILSPCTLRGLYRVYYMSMLFFFFQEEGRELWEWFEGCSRCFFAINTCSPKRYWERSFS